MDAARRAIGHVASHDPALAPILEGLDAASFTLSDLATQLASYLGSLDADSGRELETVQERRSELAALARKHGGSLDAAIDQLDTGSARLMELDHDADRITETHRRGGGRTRAGRRARHPD